MQALREAGGGRLGKTPPSVRCSAAVLRGRARELSLPRLPRRTTSTELKHGVKTTGEQGFVILLAALLVPPPPQG